ncbi:hypothetical protein B0H14DRAFT_2779610 [Mycena olivaceomarginata]|nr:hypothetical protein B0H14DRAFT_2779610 [Mycena olivaceomarginata]
MASSRSLSVHLWGCPLRLWFSVVPVSLYFVQRSCAVTGFMPYQHADPWMFPVVSTAPMKQFFVGESSCHLFVASLGI